MVKKKLSDSRGTRSFTGRIFNARGFIVLSGQTGAPISIPAGGSGAEHFYILMLGYTCSSRALKPTCTQPRIHS